MGSRLSSHFPQSLCRIEFRAIWRQVVDLNPFSIFSEPFPGFGAFMVRGIVLYKIDFLVFLKHLRPHILQEIQVGRDVEDFIAAVDKL